MVADKAWWLSLWITGFFTAGVILLTLVLSYTRLNSSERRTRDIPQYGLKEITQSRIDDSENGVDIIFVHGLGSSQSHAWSTKPPADGSDRETQPINWVEKFLIEDLRKELPLNTSFRVFLYGYDSGWMFDAPDTTIRSLAKGLIDTIRTRRKSARRTVFVAHSHGGLVVKQALVSDFLENSDRPNDSISNCTNGLIFFGTPHKGSDLARTAKVLSFLLAPWGSQIELLRSLDKSYKPLSEWHDDFMGFLKRRHDGKEIRIWNYWEERRTTIISFGLGIKYSEIVVTKDSATFDFPGCQNSPLQQDHKSMNKFWSRNDDYRKVLGAIVAATRLATAPFTISKDLKTECLRSLSFPNIDTRRNMIEIAHGRTCDWFFHTEDFQRWRHRREIESYNGVMWIRGKPGAGKSTIMKHLYRFLQNETSEALVVAYFYNARGDVLERTPLGMYRSLLYQLLDSNNDVLQEFIPLFLAKQRKHQHWNWELGELQEFILEKIPGLSAKPQRFLIDALDECVESEVKDVVSFLEKLSVICLQEKSRISICMSSRHYPTIEMKKRIGFVLDTNPGHNEDIIIYIRDKLRIERDVLRLRIFQKSNGIFMWVILVVKMLNDARGNGDWRDPMEILEDIPPELDKLFESLLKNENQNLTETVLMLQWILFSKNLLRPEELYFAVLSGIVPDKLRSLGDIKLRPWSEDGPRSREMKQQIKNFITNRSRGLIEIRTAEDDEANVQFIHETVRDYLLRHKGLVKLDPTLEPNGASASHGRIVYCCLSYLKMDTLTMLAESKNFTSENLAISYPFLEYASLHILFHAEQMLKDGIRQVDLMQELMSTHSFRNLAKFHDIFSTMSSKKYGYDTNFLYAVSLHGYSNLLQVIDLETRVEVNAQGGYYGTALQAAAAWSNEKTLQLLLEAGANVNAQRGFYGTALQAAAAARRNEKKVQLLLDVGAEVNAQGGHYGTALQAAAAVPKYGSEKTVQLLLEAGAEVNAQGGYYGTALQAAAAVPKYGSQKTVQLLLDVGAEVNAQGGYYGTALQAAAAGNNERTVQLLLEVGAKVNAQGGHYGTALQAAAAAAGVNEKFVQLQLVDGAELNAQEGHYSTALQAAWLPKYDSEETVQLLLEAGADVTARGGHFGTALQAAAADGNDKTVQLLLKAGADVNAQGGECGTALQAAAAWGRERTVQLLLEAGAY